MNKLTLAILVFLISFMNAQYAFADNHYDRCDNIIDTEKGEPHGGPFLGLDMVMSTHFFAKRYCERPMPPLAPFFKKLLQTNGCGPNTAIYKDLMDGWGKMNKLSISEYLAMIGDNSSLSDEEVEQRVGEFVEERGGCGELIIRFSKDFDNIKN